ncbi:MAG: ABC transporter permease [Acidobacteriota bacterium]
MLRTLRHFWPMNLSVAAGAAVATAVLTGALLVGDSVRNSLRELTLERLGGIDHALAGQRFFSRDAAQRLADSEEFQQHFRAVAPAILLQGSALHAESRTRASNVGLQGIDETFLGIFDPEQSALFDAEASTLFTPAVINASLQDTLQAEVGDQMLVSLKRWSDVPRSSLLGRKDTASAVETIRLEIQSILPDDDLGRFGLTAHQSSPYNVFVPLAALQKALDQEGQVNGLVAAELATGSLESGETLLNKALRSVLEPSDLGLTLSAEAGVVTLESEEFILKSSTIQAAQSIAQESGAQTLPLLTYLANGIRFGDRLVPYSTVAATDTARALSTFSPTGPLTLVDSSPAPALGPEEILLNAWTAEDLGAQVGDKVVVDYYRVGPREELIEEQAELEVRGVVTLEGFGADPTLSQEYPGIAGNENMADWDPPFPIDLGEIRTVDEDYWDRYRGTPKAFIATETGKRLWQNRWGELTGMRIAAAADSEVDSDAQANTFSVSFGQQLVESLPLEAFGMSFQPVKRLGLAASTGSSNYSGYFVGFSFFLIISAALLVALLFSLGVEQRVAEVGLLQAIGYSSTRVRRRLVAEGGLIAVLGGLVGLAGAVGYAALMMMALRTWWRPAFGTSELYLHVEPASMVIGFVLSVLVVLFAIWRRVRRLREVSTSALLKRVAEPPSTRAGRSTRWTAIIALGVAAALLIFALATDRTRDPAIFGIAGPSLLVGLLALFALRLGQGAGKLERPGAGTILRMAAANGSRHRSRSILATTLVASASFMIVTIAAFHQDFASQALGRDSGTGGYALIGESDVPLLYDLDASEGRFELGFSDENQTALADVAITPMRLLPGDDTSCLNLYQPREPRILAVPPGMIERGGFLFQNTVEDVDNPWTLLEQDLGEGVIPAFGDINSTQWILKLPLGEELTMPDGLGGEVRIRLVGNLKTSIFQSELLISQANFEHYFPQQEGASVFLIDAPQEQTASVTQVLESSLGPYGFDVQESHDKLASFHAVQNTFLSTFRTLGGLGLLLGTVGLAIVLLRNVLERRGELATLRAFGYRRTVLTWMVLIENSLLLIAGLAIGTLAALVTAGPHLLSAGSTIPWSQILGTLGGILLFGLLACAAASIGALRIPLIPALKAEH